MPPPSLGRCACGVCGQSFYRAGRKYRRLLDRDRFSFIVHDVVHPLPDLDADIVYNLACPASPVHYRRNPVETVRTNVSGTIHACELARKTGAVMIQASTSEVYGDPLVHPQPEEYRGNVNPVGPRACYDEGKRCAETILSDYVREYGMDGRIVRIFNTYGPAMAKDDGRVVSNFLVQALRGDDITIYGDGKQTRSFQYVDDLIDALFRIAERGKSGNIFNIGNPEERTILSIAETVVEKTGSKSKIVFRPLPQDDPARRCPDISRAKRELGWEPRVSFDRGLEKTIAYFRTIV